MSSSLKCTTHYVINWFRNILEIRRLSHPIVWMLNWTVIVYRYFKIILAFYWITWYMCSRFPHNKCSFKPKDLPDITYGNTHRSKSWKLFAISASGDVYFIVHGEPAQLVCTNSWWVFRFTYVKGEKKKHLMVQNIQDSLCNSVCVSKKEILKLCFHFGTGNQNDSPFKNS